MTDNGLFDATLIVTFGRHARVRDANGRELAARPQGRRMDCVCGDRVTCRHDPGHDEVHIVAVLPRRSLLNRSDARGRAEAVVANVDLLGIVVAPAPAPDLFLLDRYLAAAQCAGIDALLLVNKIDLDGGTELLTELQALGESLGVPVLALSANTNQGIDELRQRLAGRLAVFVGQSGVGKSSLLARLLPQAAPRTQTLDRDDEGRHTTTRSEMFQLPGGGALIDSPGVRDYAPAVADLEPRSLGFTDIARLAPACRFMDCRHLREPHCAVRAAVEAGQLDPRRYESYRRLRRLHEDLSERQPYRNA
jgi:ribosome biogenesis GTPase / thiamine phosphate phosphatase